mgnify:CR=1 FL=1
MDHFAMKFFGRSYNLLSFNKIILKEFFKTVENDFPAIVSLRCQKQKQGPATLGIYRI